MTTNVYLAASFRRKTELQGYRDLFQRHGLTVTSRWLDEPVDDTAHVDTVSADYSAQCMADNLIDMDAADSIVLFSNGMGSSSKGGGRFFEFGYMYAKQKTCIVVGEPEIVFQYGPDIIVVPDVRAAISTILSKSLQETWRNIRQMERNQVIKRELLIAHEEAQAAQGVASVTQLPLMPLGVEFI